MSDVLKQNDGAKKYDTGKPDLSLVPTVAIEQMARAFMLGEKKYGRYNFYKGMEASRLTAAALRHIHTWNEGEELDPESGYSHLGHALACISMILKQQELGTLKDNRYSATLETIGIPIVESVKVPEENADKPIHSGKPELYHRGISEDTERTSRASEIIEKLVSMGEAAKSINYEGLK